MMTTTEKEIRAARSRLVVRSLADLRRAVSNYCLALCTAQALEEWLEGESVAWSGEDVACGVQTQVAVVRSLLSLRDGTVSIPTMLSGCVQWLPIGEEDVQEALCDWLRGQYEVMGQAGEDE